MSRLSHAVVIIIGVALLGCATPAQRFDEHAVSLGFATGQLKTTSFIHRYFSNRIKTAGTLHVYLDGDGTPWEHRRWIAEDPTSRNPMILDLMQLDPAPAIMLGRPCYHGAGPSEICHFRYWTSHRYADEVVKSMAAALTQWLANKRVQRLVLIGYSGGGVLAMLLAPYLEKVSLIVTIAANLDVAGWIAFHGYSPLQGSLNPADTIDNISHIQQIHCAGGEDERVPLALIRKVVAKSSRARLIEYRQFDHACCWVDQWSKILTEFVELRTTQ